MFLDLSVHAMESSGSLPEAFTRAELHLGNAALHKIIICSQPSTGAVGSHPLHLFEGLCKGQEKLWFIVFPSCKVTYSFYFWICLLQITTSLCCLSSDSLSTGPGFSPLTLPFPSCLLMKTVTKGKPRKGKPSCEQRVTTVTAVP